MGNSDPFLTYLKSFGYSVIRLPRTDIAPLQVLVKEGTRLTRLGDLVAILKPGEQVALPVVKSDIPAANISGERTRDLSIGVGLSILGNVIGAMGGSKLGLDVGYKNAKTATFEFADVLEDHVDLIAVDQYLSDADISAFSHHAAQLLEADAVYVTTSVIKTKKFIVQAKQNNGVTLDVKVPEIQNAVGGNVKVSTTGGTSDKVLYEGAVPLVFGFQAARVYYENGRYSAFKPLHAGRDRTRSVGAGRAVPAPTTIAARAPSSASTHDAVPGARRGRYRPCRVGRGLPEQERSSLCVPDSVRNRLGRDARSRRPARVRGSRLGAPLRSGVRQLLSPGARRFRGGLAVEAPDGVASLLRDRSRRPVPGAPGCLSRRQRAREQRPAIRLARGLDRSGSAGAISRPLGRQRRVWGRSPNERR